jgi:hypothetical protein
LLVSRARLPHVAQGRRQSAWLALVDVGGVTKVPATVTSTVCGVAASPYKAVACVELQGQQGGSCMQGTDTAQVYFEPYTPGATHLDGRGCGHRPDPAADNCQILGQSGNA